MAKKITGKEKGKTGKAAVKPAKKAGKTDAEWQSLADELRGLIPQLDSEGLAFLVEQANVHLYNMQVEELNKTAAAADTASARAASAAKAAGIKRGRGTPKAESDNLRIDGTESGSSYYLHYRNDSAMFSRDEMIHLVKIVNAPGTDLEIRERLYNWLDRERRDIFALIPIADKFDARLKALAALLKKSFKIRGG